MLWKSTIWSTYIPSYCYGHDEPTISYVSNAPGSGGDANFRVTLPADGATFTQADFYATIWFGGTVYDVASTNGGGQAFLEFQFYPAPPASTGIGSGANDCLPDGSFNYVYTPGSNEWFACAIVWQLTGAGENAGFAGPLNIGSSSSILVMHSNDVLYVNYSGIAKSSSQGWKISVDDVSSATSGSVTLVNGSLILSPYYSTAAAGDTLGWGASNPGAIAFAYEIGHSLNGSIPQGNAYGGCSPGDLVCDSYWPGEWAQAGQMDLELPVMGQAGSQTYPSKVVFSSSQGGEAEVESYAACPTWTTLTSTNCLYPWYQYRGGSYGFTYGASNVTNATHTYGSVVQFPSTTSGGQWNGNSQSAPWGTLATAVSPLSATVEFNRMGQTNVLVVAPNGTVGGQFEEGPYWLNVSAPGCTSVSTFVYVLTGAVDRTPAGLSCNGAPPLSATAGASTMSGAAPLSVTFNGSESGGAAVFTWAWTFGDTAVSSMRNPSHTYSSAGTFEAILTVTDSNSDTAASSVLISVTGPLSASASANRTSGPAPLSVRFTGSASGGSGGNSFAWTFGDGQSSGAQNPTHTYAAGGQYTASLTVTDSHSDRAYSSVVIHAISPSTYTVWFNQTGLAGGINWTVSVGGSPQTTQGRSLQFSLVNGSHAYVVSDANSSFHPLVTHGNFVVAGVNQTVAVSFVWVSYLVLFNESTLPLGLSWTVHLGNATNMSVTGSIGFRTNNGTYSYSVVAPSGYAAPLSSGQVVVSGRNVTANVTFTELTFGVAFHQQSLVVGTIWNVTFNGTRRSSVSNWDNFTAPDGTYAYTVGPVKGFNATVGSGNVTVDLSNQTILVDFVPWVFEVTVQETGLPNGTVWGFTVGGNHFSTNHSSDQFGLPNGSYTYTVDAVKGYDVANGSGTVQVIGQAVTIEVHFSATSASTGSSPAILTGPTLLLALVAVAALVAGTVIYAVGARRRRNSPGPP